MELAEEWVNNSTNAVQISLVDEDGSEQSFKPLFTYPIYGDKELIYGYKNLNIDLKFDATTLLPFVDNTYDRKVAHPEEEPVAKLLEYLPESTCTDITEWGRQRKQEMAEFNLPGEPVGEPFHDQKNDGTYQVRYVTLKDLELHKRLRIFILFFIEAGSFVELEDDRWQFYLVYRTDTKNPKFVGFSSTYPYFWYKDNDTHAEMEQEWPVRMRISQFVILTPYQGKHLGHRLYDTLFNKFLQDDRIKEVTVEDPSERFDDLRDRCDLQRLARLGVWDQHKFKHAKEIDQGWLEKTREQMKMAPRQFSRCVEMALLHNFGQLAPDKAYKLFVKRRVYARNQEALQGMSREDIIGKLDEVFESMMSDYHRIIGPVDFSTDKKGKKRQHSEM